jgi:hypothetical protein
MTTKPSETGFPLDHIFSDTSEMPNDDDPNATKHTRSDETVVITDDELDWLEEDVDQPNHETIKLNL